MTPTDHMSTSGPYAQPQRISGAAGGDGQEEGEDSEVVSAKERGMDGQREEVVTVEGQDGGWGGSM